MNAPVDPAEAASRAWDGTDGDYWAINADRFDESMASYLEPLFAAAQLGAEERVLDIGCGNGVTSIEAARRIPAGSVVGVDLSGAMLEVARQRAAGAGLANVEFLKADAQSHPFEPDSFDVAISRFGVMFFVDAPAAFANIARALRPGGRVLFAVWQAPSANTWMRVIASALAPGGTMPTPPPDAPGPVSLADPDRVRALLGGAGFDEVTLTSVERSMCFGRDVDSTYEFAAGQPCVRYLLKDLDDEARAAGLARLRAALAERLTPEGVMLPAAAWFVAAVRR